jgi:uncharacterized protein YggE
MVLMAVALLAVPIVQSSPVLAAPPSQDDAPDAGDQRTITVTGYGVAYGAPDVVQVGLGVESLNADILVAMDDVTARMNAVMDVLEQNGVEATDIRTESFYIYQEYPYGQPPMPVEGAEGSTGTDQPQTVFRVSTTVAVTVRQTENIAPVLAAAVNAGANMVNYIQFNIEDRQALESEARGLAVDDARTRAEELASLMGLSVGEPLRVAEGDLYNNPIFYGGGGGMGAAQAAPPPISQGQLSVNMTVNVTFALVASQ